MDQEQQSALWARVAREHEEDPHPELTGGRLRLHLAVHVVVETQLAEGSPSQVQETLDRLIERGLERHEAVHAIGEVAAEEVVACLSTGERYDEVRYVSRLRDL